MNWTKRVSTGGVVRWVTDCGCVVRRHKSDGGKSEYYIARNSHGSRIATKQLSFVGVIHEVEQYIQQRTDAGLYPYNNR